MSYQTPFQRTRNMMRKLADTTKMSYNNTTDRQRIGNAIGIGLGIATGLIFGRIIVGLVKEM